VEEESSALASVYVAQRSRHHHGSELHRQGAGFLSYYRVLKSSKEYKFGIQLRCICIKELQTLQASVYGLYIDVPLIRRLLCCFCILPKRQRQLAVKPLLLIIEETY
jgi:hypothetical protein